MSTKIFMALVTYHIAGMFDRGRVSKFCELSVIYQTKISHILFYKWYPYGRNRFIRQTFFANS